MDTPTDQLFRALAPDLVRAETRDDDGRRHLYGHFAVFNRWTEIDSLFEGNFLERLAPGSFKRTINARRDQIKVLYDHGYDPQIGNKPLGPIEKLSEDKHGVEYDVPLIDTDYNRDFIIPAADEGLLGASFRFRVVDDEWDDEPARSEANPKGIPERTIREVKLYEFGPVTFPAYSEATAALRSTVPPDVWRRLDDSKRTQLFELLRDAHDLRTSVPVPATSTTGTEPATDIPSDPASPSHFEGLTPGARARALRELSGALT